MFGVTDIMGVGQDVGLQGSMGVREIDRYNRRWTEGRKA